MTGHVAGCLFKGSSCVGQSVVQVVKFKVCITEILICQALTSSDWAFIVKCFTALSLQGPVPWRATVFSILHSIYECLLGLIG